MININLPHLASIVGKGSMGAVQSAMTWASPAFTSFVNADPDDLMKNPQPQKKITYPEGMPQYLLNGYSREDDLTDYYDDLSARWWEEHNKARLGGYVEEEDGTRAWHGATRVPSYPNEGLLLKMVGETKDKSHPTWILGLLGELNYVNEQTGKKEPNKLYRKNEGFFKDRIYSFPSNQKVSSSEFTPVPSRQIEEWMDFAFDYDSIAKYVLPNEVIHSQWVQGDRPGLRGGRYYAYPDSGPDQYLTIGIGHLIDPRKPESLRFTKQQLESIGLDHIDVTALSKGEIGLTEDEMRQLFVADIRAKRRIADDEFPELYLYPTYVQAAIIDGFFWGMLPKSPKTIQLIKEGKFKEAGEEFLDNSSYRRNLNKPRFHRFRDAMNRWAAEGGD